MNRRKLGYVLLPLVLVGGIIAGVFIGKVFFTRQLSPQQEKLLSILHLIENEYVDSIDVDSLLEQNYAQLISLLDPHSAYIPASELIAVNEDLDGSFSGVGVSFQIVGDTVNIIEIVGGGPAEKVGLQAGDKILQADTVDLTGTNATEQNVFKNLRGKKGTKVTLTVKRSSSAKPLKYEITRGDVPVNSVDCSYIVDNGVGYIKVSKFSRTTYDEFYESLNKLSAIGAKKFVIDLRGNSGGYLDQAILMANEFLPSGEMIVYTKGKNPINQSVSVADGSGNFVSTPVAVLMDEFSASASEVFAGALQDHDRALIVGRRTFGKGLVQNQTDLFDNSALRLTVARYYTPSGRSIQKEYKRGESGKYELDITDRYLHGEIYSLDSIKVDRSKVYHTAAGRTVYGGGGILPDYFVPEDTTAITSYYMTVVNKGLIRKYAYMVADKYRPYLKNVHNAEELMKIIPRDATLLQNFVDYAAANGVPARWYYIRISQNLILSQLKSLIVRDALGYDAFIRQLNSDDATLKKALEALRKGIHPKDVTLKLPSRRK